MKVKKLTKLVCNKTNIIFQNIFILRNTAQMCRLLAVDGGGLGPSVNPSLVDWEKDSRIHDSIE